MRQGVLPSHPFDAALIEELRFAPSGYVRVVVSRSPMSQREQTLWPVGESIEVLVRAAHLGVPDDHVRVVYLDRVLSAEHWKLHPGDRSIVSIQVIPGVELVYLGIALAVIAVGLTVAGYLTGNPGLVLAGQIVGIAAIFAIGFGGVAIGTGTSVGLGFGLEATAGTIGLAAAGVITATNITLGLLSPLTTDSPTPQGISNSPSLGTLRNSLPHWRVFPRVFGTVVWAPPYAAFPYTEIVGGKMYLRALFNLGYGPLDISEHQVEGTSLESLGDDEEVQLEVRQGLASDPPITLYPSTVTPVEVGATLYSDETGADGGVQGFVTRSTPVDTERVEIDLLWPGGLSQTVGKTPSDLPMSGDLAVQYREQGSTDPADWTPFPVSALEGDGHVIKSDGYGVDQWQHGGIGVSGSTVLIPGEFYLEDSLIGWTAQALESFMGAPHILVPVGPKRTIIGNGHSGANDVLVLDTALPASAEGVRIGRGNGVRFSVLHRGTLFGSISAELPSRGAWEIRVGFVRDINALRGTPQAVYQCEFPGFKAFNNDDPFPHQTAKVALRIRASGRFQGQLDSYTCKSTSLLRKYDPVTQTWGGEYHATRRAAWAFAEVLRGESAKRPRTDAEIDGESLHAWEQEAIARGWRVDTVVDFSTPTRELLNNICATSQASLHIRDGKIGVLLDLDRSAESPVALLTSKNTRDGSQSGSIAFPKLPHAFRTRFRSLSGEPRERIIYRDGYSKDGVPGTAVATEFASLETWGIRDPVRAHEYARFQFKQLQYRVEGVQEEMDLEHASLERGDLVGVEIEAGLIGESSGRLKSVAPDGGATATSAEVNETLLYRVGVDYGIFLRNADVAEVHNVTNPATTEDVESNTITFVTPLSVAATGIAAGDLIAFGERERVVQRMIVNEIGWAQDLGAALSLTPEAPEIFSDMAGETIPPFEDDDQIVLLEQRPQKPSIVSYSSLPGGVLTLFIRAGSGRGLVPFAADVEWRERPDGPWLPGGRHNFTGSGVEARISGAVSGRTYELRARAVAITANAVFVASDWVSVDNVLYVDPDSTEIDLDVTALRVVSSSKVLSEAVLVEFGFEAGVATPNAVYEFFGPSVELDWRLHNRSATFDILRELPDPLEVRGALGQRWGGYVVKVYDFDLSKPYPYKGQLRRVEDTNERSYLYSLERNQQDGSGAAQPALVFEVSARLDGTLEGTQHVIAWNLNPTLPQVLDVRQVSSAIELTLFAEPLPDLRNLKVWISETSGFGLSQSTLAYDAPMVDGEPVSLPIQLEAGDRTLYYRYALTDSFPRQTSGLNVSTEQALLVTGLQTGEVNDDAITQHGEVAVVGGLSSILHPRATPAQQRYYLASGVPVLVLDSGREIHVRYTFQHVVSNNQPSIWWVWRKEEGVVTDDDLSNNKLRDTTKVWPVNLHNNTTQAVVVLRPSGSTETANIASNTVDELTRATGTWSTNPAAGDDYVLWRLANEDGISHQDSPDSWNHLSHIHVFDLNPSIGEVVEYFLGFTNFGEALVNLVGSVDAVKK